MPHKIIYYTDGDFFGGTEQIMLYLLAGLDRQNWSPVLFYHPSPVNRELSRAAGKLGIRTEPTPRMIGAASIFKMPDLYRRIRRERPAIFHAHQNWLLSCKYGLAAARAALTPVVMATLQQYFPPPWPRTVALQQQVLKGFVDRYIAVSEAVAAQLSGDFGVSTSKIKLVYNSVPSDGQIRSSGEVHSLRHSLAGDRPVVLTIARLDRQKGHAHLLRAIERVPEAVFWWVGDGPELTALQEQARGSGLQERVVFLGFRQDVPDLLAASDLFVLPSLYEGLPLSVLEAMAAGKPVVATLVGGNPEAVLDGVTGLLTPSADPNALASAINFLISNPNLAARYGKAGQARVRERFSVDSMVQGVVETYDELLAMRRKKQVLSEA